MSLYGLNDNPASYYRHERGTGERQIYAPPSDIHRPSGLAKKSSHSRNPEKSVICPATLPSPGTDWKNGQPQTRNQKDDFAGDSTWNNFMKEVFFVNPHKKS